MTHPQSDIRFGTDGWRAVIGKGYTLENVRRVAAATASWIADHYGRDGSIVIGRDPRNMGEEAARETAALMASSGIRVYFSENITPTPAISWAAKEYGCSAGVVITASHNPPEYNGFKIKAHFGGSALPEMIVDVERRLMPDSSSLSNHRSFEELVGEGLIEKRPVRDDYIAHLRTTLDLDLIRTSGIRVVHDAMFGAGQGVLSALLGFKNVFEMHSVIDPTFGGTAPEPIENNLAEMSVEVVSGGYSAGIANDGDADRIGMCDENGNFVDSHRLLALLARYLHEDKGLTGDIVKTFSTTDLLDKLGSAYGLNVHTTPIGFKYIGQYFLDGNVLVGGEESGGIAVAGHIPERDGLYIGVLILEMMAFRKKSLSVLVDELHAQFGYHAYHREDKHTSDAAKEAALRLLKESGGLKDINGKPVISLETLDGFKHRMESGWLLVRPSGTEPVLRIYSEASSESEAQENVASAIKQLGI